MHAPLRTLVAAALSMLALGATSATFAADETAPEGLAATGVEHELLAETRPPAYDDERLEIHRIDLEPGAVAPALEYNGAWLARVESGEVEVLTHDGDVWIQGFRGTEDEPIEGVRRVRLEAGELLGFGPDAVLGWENVSSGPAGILLAAIPDADRASMRPASEAAFQRPQGEVVERLVLSGPGVTEEGYRITVKDRSGQVIGAWIPGQKELRFAEMLHGVLDWDEVGIGPVAHLKSGRKALLLRWGGGVCGPIVTVDVDQDLSSIEVVDRSPGCDLAGQTHWLVLKLTGQVPPPEDIEGRYVRRAPR